MRIYVYSEVVLHLQNIWLNIGLAQRKYRANIGPGLNIGWYLGWCLTVVVHYKGLHFVFWVLKKRPKILSMSMGGMKFSVFIGAYQFIL